MKLFECLVTVLNVKKDRGFDSVARRCRMAVNMRIGESFTPVFSNLIAKMLLRRLMAAVRCFANSPEGVRHKR